jgi:hypothetical protein
MDLEGRGRGLVFKVLFRHSSGESEEKYENTVRIASFLAEI